MPKEIEDPEKAFIATQFDLINLVSHSFSVSKTAVIHSSSNPGVALCVSPWVQSLAVDSFL